jgi:hypothetical protein
MGMALHVLGLVIALWFLFLAFDGPDIRLPRVDDFDEDFLERHNQTTADWDCMAGDGLD